MPCNRYDCKLAAIEKVPILDQLVLESYALGLHCDRMLGCRVRLCRSACTWSETRRLVAAVVIFLIASHLRSSCLHSLLGRVTYNNDLRILYMY